LPDTDNPTEKRGGGVSDFDFLQGAWRVHHRQRRERLAGCDEWIEFGGTMEADPIRLRFLWERPTPTTARWTQAFSADGSATWEINWIMEFSRT
jgi:hypothetical protein